MKRRSAADPLRISLLVAFSLLSLIILGVAGRSTVLPSAATTVSATPAISATPAALSTAEITRRFNDALHATAAAIVRTLPTLTPIPDLPAYKAEDRQKTDLWAQALNTAVVLYPPPVEYDPRTLHTPDPPHTPWPTAVIPRRPLGDGTLYNVPALDSPCNVMRSSNFWEGRIAGVTTSLCAGRTQDYSSNAGLLIAETLTEDPDHPVHDDLYHPPPEFGAVWIVDILGTQVILQSTAGQQLAVDLATHQWVTPAPLPSLSPAQSPGPSPSPSPPPSPGPSVTP